MTAPSLHKNKFSLSLSLSLAGLARSLMWAHNNKLSSRLSINFSFSLSLSLSLTLACSIGRNSSNVEPHLVAVRIVCEREGGPGVGDLEARLEHLGDEDRALLLEALFISVTV